MVNRQKKVICLDTGEIFESVGEAARYAGRRMSTMSRHLHGERATCGGKRYQFYDEYQSTHICDMCPNINNGDCPGYDDCQIWQDASRGLFS